jgi:outer membrane protein
MKKLIVCLTLSLFVAFPATTFAFGVEFAAGGWRQSPSGDLSYKAESSQDVISIDDDVNYADDSAVIARAKIDMPLFIPNIYLMFSPMSFSGDGSKDVDFEFGDVTFSSNVDFYSELTLDAYDIALYYDIPFLKTATDGFLNIDLGLNIRVIDFYGRVVQEDTGLEESESYTLPVPMVYLGAQVMPLDWVGVEGEFRGISYEGNYYYSLIGRVKVKIYGPIFGAVGYRLDTVSIDVDDFEADIDFSGMFLEAGFKF